MTTTDDRQRVQCTAIRRDGTRCTTKSLLNDDRCFAHSERLASQRREMSARGGRNSSRTERAKSHLPPYLQELLDTLIRLVDEVHEERTSARAAEVIGGIAGRILDYQRYADERAQASEIEPRLAALEARLKLKSS